MRIRLTVDPQSPSPTLPSHSFRLSFRFIIAFAAASMATSRIWPCSFSCNGWLRGLHKANMETRFLKNCIKTQEKKTEGRGSCKKGSRKQKANYEVFISLKRNRTSTAKKLRCFKHNCTLITNTMLPKGKKKKKTLHTMHENKLSCIKEHNSHTKIWMNFFLYKLLYCNLLFCTDCKTSRGFTYIGEQLDWANAESHHKIN